MQNNRTIRNAFIMKLKPGFETEYKKRHQDVWPEIKLLLSDSGIQDYTIFLDEQSGTLFGCQKLCAYFDRSSLSSHPLMIKWWDFMSDIVQTNVDNSPVAIPLEEVFHLR